MPCSVQFGLFIENLKGNFSRRAERECNSYCTSHSASIYWRQIGIANLKNRFHHAPTSYQRTSQNFVQNQVISTASTTEKMA